MLLVKGTPMMTNWSHPARDRTAEEKALLFPSLPRSRIPRRTVAGHRCPATVTPLYGAIYGEETILEAFGGAILAGMGHLA